MRKEVDLPLKKTYKRGGSTVIWKWKWCYKSAPENDFPIPENDSETGFGRMSGRSPAKAAGPACHLQIQQLDGQNGTQPSRECLHRL